MFIFPSDLRSVFFRFFEMGHPIFLHFSPLLANRTRFSASLPVQGRGPEKVLSRSCWPICQWVGHPWFFWDRTSHFLLLSFFLVEIGQGFMRLQIVAIPNTVFYAPISPWSEIGQWKSTFFWKMLSKAETETQWSHGTTEYFNLWFACHHPSTVPSFRLICTTNFELKYIFDLHC